MHGVVLAEAPGIKVKVVLCTIKLEVDGTDCLSLIELDRDSGSILLEEWHPHNLKLRLIQVEAEKNFQEPAEETIFQLVGPAQTVTVLARGRKNSTTVELSIHVYASDWEPDQLVFDDGYRLDVEPGELDAYFKMVRFLL